MTWVIALMGVPVAATLGVGIWLMLKPRRVAAGGRKGGLLANLALFGLGVAGVLLMGVQEGMAAETAATAAREITLGQGLALLGIGLPTGLAAIAAAMALGPIGSASLAVFAVKAVMFGRTLGYLGLAVWFGYYVLVMSILLLGKL